MRDFEKISFNQFKKDIENNFELYKSIKIPQRDSIATAGYDIPLLKDIIIKKGEILKIPTGLKCYFEKDEVLLLVVRSSMGFKYNIRLCNQIGVIDADYYNNQEIVQGIFFKYLTTNSDNSLNQERRSDY